MTTFRACAGLNSPLRSGHHGESHGRAVPTAWPRVQLGRRLRAMWYVAPRVRRRGRALLHRRGAATHRESDGRTRIGRPLLRSGHRPVRASWRSGESVLQTFNAPEIQFPGPHGYIVLQGCRAAPRSRIAVRRPGAWDCGRLARSHGGLGRTPEGWVRRRRWLTWHLLWLRSEQVPFACRTRAKCSAEA